MWTAIRRRVPGGGAALIPNIASRLLTFLYKYKYIVQLCGLRVRGAGCGASLAELVRGILGYRVATSHFTLNQADAGCTGSV